MELPDTLMPSKMYDTYKQIGKKVDKEAEKEDKLKLCVDLFEKLPDTNRVWL
jgi:hypothetical protein